MKLFTIILQYCLSVDQILRFSLFGKTLLTGDITFHIVFNMEDTMNSSNKHLEAQRDAVIKKLEANYAHGNMSLEDFEKKLEMAVHSTLSEDLERIASNLESFSSDKESSSYDHINTGHVREEETYTCILSGIPAGRNGF